VLPRAPRSGRCAEKPRSALRCVDTTYLESSSSVAPLSTKAHPAKAGPQSHGSSPPPRRRTGFQTLRRTLRPPSCRTASMASACLDACRAALPMLRGLYAPLPPPDGRARQRPRGAAASSLAPPGPPATHSFPCPQSRIQRGRARRLFASLAEAFFSVTRTAISFLQSVPSTDKPECGGSGEITGVEIQIVTTPADRELTWTLVRSECTTFYVAFGTYARDVCQCQAAGGPAADAQVVSRH
jgi:hypothetical protein